MSVWPTILRLPANAVDFTRSQIVLDWAADAGYKLDDWQQHWHWWVNARDEHGEPAVTQAYGEVSRQNGKNAGWLEVDQLTGLLLFGQRLYIHSAYRADTAHEHFLSLQERILDDPNGLLYEYVKKGGNQGFFSANGKESIEFKDGQRILFKTRSLRTGRGPRPQRLYFDEALILDRETVDTQVPAIVAQKGGRVVFTSSAPMADSLVQHDLRERAESEADPTDTRFYAIAWNNEPEADDRDPAVLAQANPSLGKGRMTLDSINDNRRLMTSAGFRREHAGMPDPREDGDQGTVVSLDEWNNLAVSTSIAVADRTVALAVSMNRKWATIGVAGTREDGRIHLEWKVRRKGTDWIVPECVKIHEATELPIRIHRSGAASSYIDKLQRKKVDVVDVPSLDISRALTVLIDGVAQQTIRHLGQQTLHDQISAAAYRLTSDGLYMLVPRKSDSEIDALDAVVCALSGVYAEPGEDDEWFVY